jgi:hypothetical protein
MHRTRPNSRSRSPSPAVLQAQASSAGRRPRDVIDESLIVNEKRRRTSSRKQQIIGIYILYVSFEVLKYSTDVEEEEAARGKKKKQKQKQLRNRLRLEEENGFECKETLLLLPTGSPNVPHFKRSRWSLKRSTSTANRTVQMRQ